MSNDTTEDGRHAGSGTVSRNDRPKSVDGGTPTVSSRGDDQKTLLNRWGQRVVHVLLVFVPSVLIAGLVFQRAGYHGRSMEFAQAFIGITFTLVGLLAVAIVIYETLQTSRQTELTEFETFRE